MKRHFLIAVALSTALVGCKQEAAEPEPSLVLDTEEKRISYGMGIGLGKRIKQEAFAVDIDAFSEGIKHSVAGTEPLLTQEEIQKEMQNFQKQQMAKQEKMAEQQGIANQAAGKAFLAANGAKEGVTTTASGLQYKVVTEGTGAKPSATDTVEVNYAGTLIDGTEFDSSYKRGASVSFPVNGVIPGWTEALQLMPVGSKWQLFIPPELAYGPGGTGGGPIGPNATLIFDVELIAIKGADSEG